MDNASIICYHSLPTDVTTFSTTRHGGVSTGTYASLNCTPYTGDTAENVQHNRQLLAQATPATCKPLRKSATGCCKASTR